MKTTFTPTLRDSDKSTELLEALINKKANEAPRLVAGNESIDFSEQLASIFKNVAEGFSQGQTITIIAHETKMTTQQVADFLGVSRPTAIKLLEQFNIPVEKVNRHRRVSFPNVLKLQEALMQNQLQALREMHQLEIELGLLDDSLIPSSKR